MENNKIIDKMLKVLMPIANTMNRNRYIKAIRDGFALSLPYVMVGSILTSLPNIPGLSNLFGDTLFGQITSFLAPSSVMSSSILGLFVVIGVSYSLAKEYKSINPLSGSITALVMFLILCPYSITTEGGEIVNNAIPIEYLGPKAIFTGFVIAFLGVEMYRWAVEHKLTIKMPDSVPASIQNSFTSFIPAAIIILFALVVRWAFTWTSHANMTDFVYYWIQKPISGVMTSYPSMLLYGVLVNLCWLFGLHGQTMVNSLWKPVLIGAGSENVAALAAGEKLPNLFTFSWAKAFISSGCWIAIPLLIALFIYTKKHPKREDWKSVMKVGAIPGIFNIYEPFMFGLPIVLNPFMLLPMLITPLFTTTVFYTLTKLSILPFPTGADFPPTTPIGIVGALVTNNLLAGIIQILMVIPLAALWYFCLKLQDRSEKISKTGIYEEDEEE